MQRKPGFPVANCNIKMPDSIPPDNILHEEDTEQQQRRQQLINFGHSQWGFNNWSWSVSKQELDFVDFANGKYSAGVVAFVSVNIKSFDIHRDNIGYATCIASMKGSAIYQARKCAVTNALKETLLSFGGSVTTELLELLESHKNNHNNQPVAQQSDVLPENNQNLANKLPAMSIINVEPKNASAVNTVRTLRKDSSDSNSSRDNSTVSVRSSQNAIVNASVGAPLVKNASASGPCAPLVAKAHPMPANQPHSKPTLPANQPRAPPPVPAPPQPPAPQQPHHMRPNSNEPTKSDAISSLAGVNASVGAGAGTRPDPLEEARAERKRRQKLAQEQFRQRHLAKQPSEGTDAATQALEKSSIDSLLLEIPSQDLSSNAQTNAKRKSNESTASVKRPALTDINIMK